MTLRFLGLCGSLRAASENRAALERLGRFVPAGAEFVIFPNLGALPHFNPDAETDPPQSAAAFRDAVAEAGALVLAFPEYAHGIPGVAKNALDWLVGDPRFAGKPVALLNVAPRAFHAQFSVRETLATMAARLVPDAFATMALHEGGPATEIALRRAWNILTTVAAEGRTSSAPAQGL